MRKVFILFIFVFHLFNTSAQIGVNAPWTWMKGVNQTGSFGHYGTIGIEDPLNTPTARAYACTFTDVDGNLWLLLHLIDLRTFSLSRHIAKPLC